MRRVVRSTAARAWLLVFGLWAIFLSGALADLIGSPGLIQSVRLRSLLASKESRIRQLELAIQGLEVERERLAKSRYAQEREIRRVLSYTAEDELVFDFTAGERLGGMEE